MEINKLRHRFGSHYQALVKETKTNEKGQEGHASPTLKQSTQDPTNKVTRREMKGKKDEGVSIETTGKEDDFIDLSTLMDKIGVPPDVRLKVKGHKAWKRAVDSPKKTRTSSSRTPWAGPRTCETRLRRVPMFPLDSDRGSHRP